MPTLVSILKRLGHILLFFLIFHLLMFLFYVITRTGFIEYGYWNLYLKQSLINSIGFLAFYLAAFWLFPRFVSRKKFRILVGVSLLIILSLGRIQYYIQDAGFSLKKKATPVAVKSSTSDGNDEGPKIMPALPVMQSVGADVRAIFNILIYLLFGLGYAYAVDWFRKDRHTRELEKQKIESELALLRYQLNPHFLFNTINDIYYLALIKSDKTANALLELSHLLRYVLDNKESMVPLDKEIDHIHQFVKLHRFRFPNEEIIQEIELDGSAERLYIAPLLLSTFVENAFKHGDPGTSEAPVRIKLRVTDGILEYTVSNKLNEARSKDSSSGIGLPNLERRLSLLYPNAHTVSLTNNGEYFTAHLKIDLSHDQKHNH